MSEAAAQSKLDLTALAARLGPAFAERAERSDEEDAFAAENFAELKRSRAFSACIPTELGGGGASHAELAGFLRELATYCGSTALAFSMHSHVVATAVWRWRNDGAPLEPLLRRIAGEQLAMVSSGGSDWLPSSGSAEPVAGGFRIRARKAFASGSPAGDLLMTSAVLDDPAAGPTVLHFGVPLKGEGVSFDHTWRCLGMRATGSDDIVLDGVFVPESAVSIRRPKGKWHRLYHTIVLVALPLIYSVYLGIAESARRIALTEASARRNDPALQLSAGELEIELAAARIALAAHARPRRRGAALARGHQRGADGPHPPCAQRHPHRRAGAGARRRARLLPQDRSGAAVPGRPGGALPSVAGTGAAPLFGADGARPRRRRLRPVLDFPG